jgi:hypothetical protein
MQVLRQEKYMYLFSTNFVLDFVNIPKRKIFYIETKKIMLSSSMQHVSEMVFTGRAKGAG